MSKLLIYFLPAWVTWKRHSTYATAFLRSEIALDISFCANSFTMLLLFCAALASISIGLTLGVSSGEAEILW